MPAKLEIDNFDDLVSRYLSGTSLKQLSDESGFVRITLMRHFAKAGVPIRGRSDAERLKWTKIKLDPEAIKRQCGGAWAASAGSIRSFSARAKNAIAFSNSLQLCGRYEAEIISVLSLVFNVVCTPQKAIGTYNVDFSIDELSVAVEIQSDRHRRGSTRPSRIEYIIDSGWIVLIVDIGQKEIPDIAAIAKGIHTFCQLLRGDKPVFGKYGVIGRDGKAITSGRFDLPNRPRIIGF